MNFRAIESQVLVTKPLYSLTPTQLHEIDRLVGQQVRDGRHAFYIPFDGVVVISPYPCSVLYALTID